MSNMLQTPAKTDVAGKTVLVRVDFNVPLTTQDTGEVSVADDRRIVAALETMQFLRDAGAKTVLMSHLGRPQGVDHALSLAPIATYINTKHGVPVQFVGSDRVVDQQVTTTIEQLENGDIALLENTRFRQCEKKNNPEFSRDLAGLADIYINDAFSSSHRAHASTVGVAELLPSFAGFSLHKEVTMLTQLLEKPKRPFVIVLGGAKISDKVGAISHLAHSADIVLVGGAVANDFLKADGIEIHKSYIEATPADLQKEGVDYVQVARQLLDEHRSEKMLKDGYIPLPKILYPLDVIAAQNSEVASESDLEVVDLTHDMADTENDKDLQYLDIGPKTQRLFSELVAHAGTVFWNGPMGVWEQPLFSTGTQKLATTMAQCSHSIVGGGDTIAAIDHFELAHSFEYVSLAGGATLEFLSGKTLPGVGALSHN